MPAGRVIHITPIIIGIIIFIIFIDCIIGSCAPFCCAPDCFVIIFQEKYVVAAESRGTSIPGNPRPALCTRLMPKKVSICVFCARSGVS